MPGAEANLPAESWHIRPLAADHLRADFDCGENSLNEYLRHYVNQDSRRFLTRAFVLTTADSPEVLGYYTLAATSIQRERFPANQARKLPRYPVPAVLLGRLAVDKKLSGRGLGGHIIIDALKRVGQASATIGVYAVVVDAISDRAAKYYEGYGFIPLTEPGLSLFLPIDTILRIP